MHVYSDNSFMTHPVIFLFVRSITVFLSLPETDVGLFYGM